MHVRQGSNWCQLTWKFMFPLAAVLLSCLSNVLTDTAFFSVFWWAYIRTFSHVEWSMEKASRFQISLTFPSLILFVHYKKLYTHKKWPYSVVPWLMSPPEKQKKPHLWILNFSLYLQPLFNRTQVRAPNKLLPASVLQVWAGNSLLSMGRVLFPDYWSPGGSAKLLKGRAVRCNYSGELLFLGWMTGHQMVIMGYFEFKDWTR